MTDKKRLIEPFVIKERGYWYGACRYVDEPYEDTNSYSLSRYVYLKREMALTRWGAYFVSLKVARQMRRARDKIDVRDKPRVTGKAR